MHNTEFDTLDRSSALAVWRQGDFALEITEFVNIVRSPSHAEQFAANIDENVKGLVVVSQTCDIVNDKSDKDWVVVCPLVEVSEVLMDNVNSGRTPGYAPIKNVPKHNWAADLSRMMTVSKDLLITLTRRDGFDTEEERRNFAYALERKHGRFAFPNDFAQVHMRIRDHIREKYRKPASSAGRVFRSVRQIRVRADPTWTADEIIVTFIFIMEELGNRDAELQEIRTECAKLIGKLKLPSRYRIADPSHFIGTLDDFTARDYLQSDALDLQIVTFLGSAT